MYYFFFQNILIQHLLPIYGKNLNPKMGKFTPNL